MGQGGAAGRDTSGSAARASRPTSPQITAAEAVRRLKGALKQALHQQANLLIENSALRDEVARLRAAVEAAPKAPAGQQTVEVAPDNVVRIDGNPWGGDDADEEIF